PEPGPFTSAGFIANKPGAICGPENGPGMKVAPRKAAPAGPAGSPGPPLPASWNRPRPLPNACAVANGRVCDRIAVRPCLDPSVAPSVDSTVIESNPSRSGKQPSTPEGSRWHSCLSPRTRRSFSYPTSAVTSIIVSEFGSQRIDARPDAVP